MQKKTENPRMPPQGMRMHRQRHTRRQDATQADSVARTDISAPREMTDAEALEILNSLHAGDRRSTFAQALFPYDRARYGSHGQWAKAVGTLVAGDIRHNPQLRLRMERTGYVPGKTGYTLEQRIILVKYYKASPPALPVSGRGLLSRVRAADGTFADGQNVGLLSRQRPTH